MSETKLEQVYQEISKGSDKPVMAWLNGVCYYTGADGKSYYEGSEEQHKKNLELLAEKH